MSNIFFCVYCHFSRLFSVLCTYRDSVNKVAKRADQVTGTIHSINWFEHTCLEGEVVLCVLVEAAVCLLQAGCENQRHVLQLMFSCTGFHFCLTPETFGVFNSPHLRLQSRPVCEHYTLVPTLLLWSSGRSRILAGTIKGPQCTQLYVKHPWTITYSDAH